MARKKRTARVKKANTSKWGRPAGEVKITRTHVTLAIPSGKCPEILEGKDRDSVYDWVIRLTEVKLPNTVYKPSVYKYWVRDFYESYTQDYRDIGVIIDTIVPEKVSKVSDIIKRKGEAVMPSVLSS